jgi:hypothetical protein
VYASIRAKGLEFEFWQARSNKIIAADSNFHVCGLRELAHEVKLSG